MGSNWVDNGCNYTTALILTNLKELCILAIYTGIKIYVAGKSKQILLLV